VITLSSDFRVQSQGVAQMEAAIYEIAPDAKVLHLMHGLPDYDTITAAWVLESVLRLPVGKHICVVDPGVGSSRLGLIIETKRGDFLIGPDNGVLIPTARLLGIKEVVSIERRELMKRPVSSIFHGRDVFSPAAAHLENGEPIFNFGPVIDPDQLLPAPYGEAKVMKGVILAKVINVNKFGSVHLNILHKEFARLGVKRKSIFIAEFKGRKVPVVYGRTFSDVKKGHAVLFEDEYSRMEIALNMSNLAKKTGLIPGDTIRIRHYRH